MDVEWHTRAEENASAKGQRQSLEPHIRRDYASQCLCSLLYAGSGLTTGKQRPPSRNRCCVWKEYQNASSISIFLSMPGKEVSTQDIALDALRSNKSVFRTLHSCYGQATPKVIDMLQLRDEDDLNSLKA